MTPPGETTRSAPPRFDEHALLSLKEEVRAEIMRLGFSLAGFTSARPLSAPQQRRWRRWLDDDRAGEMDYLRRARPRRTHPQDLLPEARSVIVAAAGYYSGDHGDQPDAPGGESPRESDSPQSRPAPGEAAGATPPDRAAPARAKVARYAWGSDYHFVLRGRLKKLAAFIERRASELGYPDPVRWRAFSDSAPLDERALAVRAGLGFIGKNTLLLHPVHGSWMLLAELLISIPFPPDSPGVPAVGSCASCRKCLDVCPTGAFIGPYELDPRRCISYLTIEQTGPIPESLKPRLEGWAFGCDLCQEVCPFNDQ
ncbi:tRNA epoxyqueuosine(34) reductase QueG, partial [Candidatus Sumerlaeota bacterium]|nr:tRNA epoxyqueuosine(34) reductase QueG [Candidatus Sumerlaeota bacterium]